VPEAHRCDPSIDANRPCQERLVVVVHDVALRKLGLGFPRKVTPGEPAVNLVDPFSDKGPRPHGSTPQMKRGLSFTILLLLGLLASVAMAMDNNWSGAAFGCVAAGYLFVMAVV
jgi:hypothetical protein